MTFVATMLKKARPDRIADITLPDRPDGYHSSPEDWRKEVLYFLLPDRFSDGQEDTRHILDRNNLWQARPALPNGTKWRWDNWASSGAFRWQGGTIAGIRSKLDYLDHLGVTALWIGPMFKQRGTLDTFHGYGIQDFLEIDPRFGTRQTLIDLVDAAHARGIRVLLDIIFNHSGRNWDYLVDGHTINEPTYKDWPSHYSDICWLGPHEAGIQGTPREPEDGVWPVEFQSVDCYTRAGAGDLGKGDIGDAHAEHKRTDFGNLRDFNFDPLVQNAPRPETLQHLADCYKYWIALTDCDGFRIDTLKHVGFEEARNFCGAIKEFAATLGKHDFFLVGEVAGGDYNADRYLDVLGRNLNAALDIGDMRVILGNVAKGLTEPKAYFGGFDALDPGMGSHRNVGLHHVSILDDHDHVTGTKIRFSSEASSDYQVVAAVAIQLFTLGIPCIYYGTEQALSGPEPSERQFLPSWKGSKDWADRYLREAMFGPLHPRQKPAEGLAAQLKDVDETLPGFGPFGTAGCHCFDMNSHAFVRIAALAAIRKRYAALSVGRQYQREISNFNGPFTLPRSGELVAWSRILDRREMLCVVNGNGNDSRGGDIVVDDNLNSQTAEFEVLVNTAAAAGQNLQIAHPVGSKVKVLRHSSGTAYVQIRNLGPSEALILTNRP